MANLNDLSNEQRELHRQAVCKAVGLDSNPALGHLDYIWMDQESGLRNLVLYARRGTTELLRDINGIDVKSLEQHDGPGYVSFKATAVNKKGRQEIAVGAHGTEGLKGEKLAAAISTAQTRALRRVTLQFAGHGILDESEVSVQLANIASPTASVAQLAGSPAVMPPPQVVPSPAPGKDITSSENKANTTELVQPIACLDCGRPLVDHALVNSARVCPESNEPMAAEIEETPIVEVRKKRSYRRRSQVDISSPNQCLALPPQPLSIPVPQPLSVASPPPQPIQVAPQPVVAATPPLQSVEKQALTLEVTSKPTIVGLSAEKQKEYRERLGKYSQDILPKAGMLPSDGIGGVTMKLRKFATVFCSIESVQALTEEQWQDLFDFLDNYTQKNGAQALVQYIDKSLGVTK